MRKLLNRFLFAAGYRIERISRFQVELDALSQSPSHRFKFVQIGANDGVRFDGLYGYVTNHPCSGIVVEPLPDMFERLRMNYADYPHIVPVNKAVHATARSLSLFRVAASAMHRYEGWASGIASFDSNHLLDLGVAPADIAAQSVDCLPLMELLEQTQMLDADLLQTDTEGYDSAVLEMIDFTRFKPRLIRFEHKTMSAAERQAHAERFRRNGYRTVVEGTDTIAWRPR
jgi:FkbM family methyltransferase